MFLHEQLDPNSRFRERRRRARRRRRLRRAAAAAVLLGLGAGLALGATDIGQRGISTSATTVSLRAKPARPAHRAVPREIRGVHVTMGLASLPGKLEGYAALQALGLNTIELDVKDENGQVGFVSPDLPRLARQDVAARPYYVARDGARRLPS